MGPTTAMRGFTSLPRPLLLGLATLFAVATILYSAIWMYYIRWESKAQIGISTEAPFSMLTRSMRVTRVPEGSAAERAGLRPEDRIVAINGRRLDTPNPYSDAVYQGQPGDVVELTVERPGAAAPIVLQTVLQPRPAQEEEELTPAQTVAVELLRSYPVLFLVVGLGVLFLRLEDRNAWLLALLFASFIAGAPLLQMERAIHPALRGFALAYKVTFMGLYAAFFYYFFAVFPVASPVDRRLPWLKSVLLVAAAAVVVPLGLWGLLAGSSQPLLGFADRLGQTVTFLCVSPYFFGAFVLGLVSLVWNGLRAPTAEARRKIRVIVWGTVVGFTPALLLQAAAAYAKKNPYEFPFWVWAPCVLALFLLPLSFAYAVVKHRVLGVSLLLKRSARYLLVQRGFALLTVVSSVAATLLFMGLFARFVQPRVEFVVPAGVGTGVAFGLLLAWAGAQVQRRVSERIDRAFFRSAYDARQIFEELAEKTRTATNRQQLAALLEHHITEALRPTTLTIYLESSDDRLAAEGGAVPPGLETIPTSLPVLAEVARGQPWDVPPPEAGGAEALSLLGPLEPECLVPILGRDARLTGLLVLGRRRSEEPYAGEDKRLLASVASQAGTALESIGLAEQMAERLEAERRAAREMEIAKEVQANLFPRHTPLLETLEYVGDCIQTRAVGGDYYDFLDLGRGQVGLVLADIVGKGISAALLMANLQAHLRGQSAVAPDDLPRLLASVNRLLCESTGAGHYATLFFGSYDDATRRLRYANCGHNPPLLLRGDGTVERLTATATVLGMFEKWECSVAEVSLAPGDTLVIFSDGVTEAMSDEGEEFGDARFVKALRAHGHLPVDSLLHTLVSTVQEFSGREQEDDVTLVVARAR
ncbi:SpoIIE family protein phosphatase [Acidobacteriia bacterium AH_259_A11_L15]|nr:SpoIIE family protein phosphatase [Acidobacteriia bacterium AH_259_A11_L15]